MQETAQRLLLPHRIRHWGHGLLLVGCGLLAIVLPVALNGICRGCLETLELWTVDLRFQHRSPLSVAGDQPQLKSAGIAVIDYDDRAASDYGLGRWPWDRRVHAQVLDWLKTAGARVILVDLIFDRTAVDAAEDRALANSTAQIGRVFYPVILQPAVGPQDRARSHTLSLPAAMRHVWPTPETGTRAMPAGYRVIWPFTDLLAGAGGIGHVQRTPDRDGVLRRIPPVFATADGIVPALSLAAALRYLDVDSASVRIEPGKALTFTRRDGVKTVIPIDTQGRMWINYAGPWGKRFPHYSYGWLREQMEQPDGSEALREWFGDKAVILANLTTGSADQGATPLEQEFPLSEVHAHLLNMIVTNQFLRDAGPREAAAAVVLPTAGLTGLALLGGVGLLLPSYLVLLFVGMLVANKVFPGGVILPVAEPVIALSLALVLLLAARFVLVDRERMRFLAVLGAVLPPHTIRAVQESPERMAQLMAGRRKELTLLFADLQGFTEFCRTADATGVQQVLREYRAELTDILRAHGGTLDKYTGDEVMAFFGDAEPEDGDEQEDSARVARHAANAVRAGLAMQRAMQRLNEQWRARGWGTHLVRIGVNTGHVMVGNFGTASLWQYGVVGSEVNKGKRIENAAPPGGIALAPRTYALARAENVLSSNLQPTQVALKGFEGDDELFLIPPGSLDGLSATPASAGSVS
jgi:adenylate cyclase